MNKKAPKNTVYCAWNSLRILYEQYEAGDLENTDLAIEINAVCDDIEEQTDNDVIENSSLILNVNQRFIEVLVCTGATPIINFRRLLACIELANCSSDFPAFLKHKVIAKKYGFSAETVRKFYTRYPSYFKCKSLHALAGYSGNIIINS